jgi:hypothetical protein
VFLVNWNPKWWSEAWWESHEYQTEFGVSLEQVRTRINALVGLFDEEWTRDAIAAGPPNAVLTILYDGKGLWPFQDLMWLGRIALAVSPLPSVHRPLREIVGPKTRATLMELEVASWFVEDGWEVEFLKLGPGRRTPDIRVSRDGIQTAIECKRFEAEKWEDWAADLSDRLMRRLGKWSGPGAPSFDVLLEPRLSDLSAGDPAMQDGVLEELAIRLESAVQDALGSTPPRPVQVPGIGQVVLRPDRHKSQLGVGGIEISPQAKLRRIVQNGILEAAQQLTEFAPGAVVVRSDFAPPVPLVETVLRGINRANEGLLQSIAVVVIVSSLGEPPILWTNPVYSESQVANLLAATFRAVLRSPGTAHRD